VHPTVGRRGELDNECLYLYHPSRRLDLQIPLAPTPISPNHSPDLIDNLDLTGVYSNDSATTNAFLFFIYVLEATAVDIANILSMRLGEMQRNGVLNPLDNHRSSMTFHPLTNTHQTTYLDDEHITQSTIVTPPHLEGVSHAYIVTTPTFSTATYGLTLMASKHLRWTCNLPEGCIHTRLPETLTNPLLSQAPIISRKSVDTSNNAKDNCTIHSQDFQDLTSLSAFNLFKVAVIHTLHKHLTAV